MTDLNFYEFFGGGARAGLGDGWQCLLANDNDPVKMRSYTDNWGGRGAITRDVAALTTADFPSAASLGWASFPCQDLSEAGAGAGLNGERSNALWPCLGLIDALRREGQRLPMIVLENVVSLMSPRSAGL
jgi:DNA (cytosine-5)-methyltransferase 1